jgi:hypothetical protein
MSEAQFTALRYVTRDGTDHASQDGTANVPESWKGEVQTSGSW